MNRYFGFLFGMIIAIWLWLLVAHYQVGKNIDTIVDLRTSIQQDREDFKRFRINSAEIISKHIKEIDVLHGRLDDLERRIKSK